jgi:hypothetical protein
VHKSIETGYQTNFFCHSCWSLSVNVTPLFILSKGTVRRHHRPNKLTLQMYDVRPSMSVKSLNSAIQDPAEIGSWTSARRSLAFPNQICQPSLSSTCMMLQLPAGT